MSGPLPTYQSCRHEAVAFQVSLRLWHWQYWQEGRKIRKTEKLLTLGVYPGVSLARAREKRDEARNVLDRGIDPAQQCRAAKQAGTSPDVNAFGAVAEVWFAHYCEQKAQGKHPLARRRGGEPADEVLDCWIVGVHQRRVVGMGATGPMTGASHIDTKPV